MAKKDDGPKVYYHKIGTPQSADDLVDEDKANPQRFHNVSTTEDERFAILNVSDRGKGKRGNAVFFRDLSRPGERWTPIVAEAGEFSYGILDNIGDTFLIETNETARNGKVVLFDPAQHEGQQWRDVLAQRPRPPQGASPAGR